MARRTSRRRGSRRRTTRNPRYVVGNRRHSRRRSRRRVRRNLYGADLMKDVLVPVLYGAAGFVGARYLGNMWAAKDWMTTDPKVGKLIAAGVGIPATLLISKKMGAGSMVAKNSGAIMLGLGLAAAEAYLRDTPLLGGSRAAAVLTTDGSAANGGAILVPEGPVSTFAPLAEQAAAAAAAETTGDGLSAYYTQGMLGSLGDPADQAQVEATMDRMEPVSTVIPTDTAMRAGSWPQERRVTEPFANRSDGDRGHAGGIYARHLFSGMMGG